MFDPKERVSLNGLFVNRLFVDGSFVDVLCINGFFVDGLFVDAFFNPTNRSFDLKTNNDLHQPE